MTYEELQKAYNELRIKYENQEIELNNLRRIIFGRKREYTPIQEQEEEQCSLFEDEKEMDEEVEKEVKEKVEEITVYKNKKAKKKRAGIKRSKLKEIIIKREEYKLADSERCERCEKCGKEIDLVGKKVVRQEVEYKPAELILKEYVKYISVKSVEQKEVKKRHQVFMKQKCQSHC